MIQEKTKHFPRCIRSPGIGVRARRAAARPCVSGAMDAPVLYDFASARVSMGCAGVCMASGYLAAMQRYLRARLADGLLNNLTGIAWMHGGVAVAVKNNCRHRRLVAGNDYATGCAALSHGGKCGGHVGGGPVGEAGMDPDRRIQL